jgi:hypothetical protein
MLEALTIVFVAAMFCSGIVLIVAAILYWKDLS